jgi:Putative addiction module component
VVNEALLREALALPDPERADLAAELLASLDADGNENPETTASLWRTELARRAEQVVSGEVPTEDWADIRQRLAAEFTG